MSRYSVFFAIVLATFGSTTLHAQQSAFKPPSNLRVLPKDTRLAELIPMMKDKVELVVVLPCMISEELIVKLNVILMYYWL